MAERPTHELMPAVYSPRSQCEGKKPYRTKRDAKAAVKRHERSLGERLQAYHCVHCDAYHIGHKVNPRNRTDTSTEPVNVNGPGDVESVPGPDQPERS